MRDHILNEIRRLSAKTGRVVGKRLFERETGITDGRSVLVPGSEHFIQIDKPDVVVAEIMAVVEKVRARPSGLN